MLNGETYHYTKVPHPECQINSVGYWFCDEAKVDSGQCLEEELCCGPFRMPDYPEGEGWTRGQVDWLAAWPMHQPDSMKCLIDNVIPSAYTPRFEEPFTLMLDKWLSINSVTVTTTDAPDGACVLHLDEYNCNFEKGCYWDQGPAHCLDLPDFGDGTPPHMELNQPVFGDTANR